jgi:5'-nucleotidase
VSRSPFVASLLACLGAAAALACAAPPAEPPNAPKPPEATRTTLSVFATNDVHGQLEKFPILAGFLDNLERARARDGAVLAVDAGDAIQGTIESALNEGSAAFAAYGRMGYAALALGNHEFDFGPVGPKSMPGPGDDPQGALEARIAEAPFPVLSANLATSEGKLPAWKNLGASTLVTVDRVRIGIVGLLTADAADVIKRPYFVGLHTTPLAGAATREAAELRKKGADVVVVVAHAGGACARFEDPNDLSSCDANSEIFALARALPSGLVDVIVGGHRNAAVAHVVNGIPIVHAESHLVGFSRVDLVWDRVGRRVVEEHVFPPHPLCTKPFEDGCAPGTYEGADVVPDSNVEAAVRPALEAARAVRDAPVGADVAAPFAVAKHGEMALGNLFADLMREAVPGADAAFGNAGSVRDTLPAGPLTYGRLLHVMPFDNQLAKLHLTGAELRALVATNLGDGGHGLLSFSGVQVSARCDGTHPDVTLKRPNGAVLRDDERLLVVTNDFLAYGGDGLLSSIHLAPEQVEVDGNQSVLDALVTGLVKRRTIRPDDPALYDPKHPRLDVKGALPLRCGERDAPPAR